MTADERASSQAPAQHAATALARHMDIGLTDFAAETAGVLGLGDLMDAVVTITLDRLWKTCQIVGVSRQNFIAVVAEVAQQVTKSPAGR